MNFVINSIEISPQINISCGNEAIVHLQAELSIWTEQVLVEKKEFQVPFDFQKLFHT